MLPEQGAKVWSPVRKLRPTCLMAQSKLKKKKKKKHICFTKMNLGTYSLKTGHRESPVAQWVGLCVFTAERLGSIPASELRSHKPCGAWEQGRIVHLNVKCKTLRKCHRREAKRSWAWWWLFRKKAQSMREVNEKLDYWRDNSERMRRKGTDWEKILAKDTSNKGLLPKITQKNS